MITAQDLISRARAYYEIIHEPYTPELAAELAALADDSVCTGYVVAFWGADWHVHLIREDALAAAEWRRSSCKCTR